MTEEQMIEIAWSVRRKQELCYEMLENTRGASFRRLVQQVTDQIPEFPIIAMFGNYIEDYAIEDHDDYRVDRQIVLADINTVFLAIVAKELLEHSQVKILKKLASIVCDDECTDIQIEVFTMIEDESLYPIIKEQQYWDEQKRLAQLHGVKAAYDPLMGEMHVAAINNLERK